MNRDEIIRMAEMNRDEIIRMAREVGWPVYSLKHPVEVERLDRFAALVAAAEREACAKVCDERERSNLYGVKECAVAIRARAILDSLRRLQAIEQDGWIKCSERLPEPDKDDFAVLVEIVRGEKRSYGYYAHQKWVDLITESGGWDVGVTDVTHWRPLPPLPRSNHAG